MKVKLLFTAVIITAATLLSSCNNDVEDCKNANQAFSIQEFDEQTAMSRFAVIVSKAIYSRKNVREFLKEEAIKQFDKNYDILYCNVKDSYIGSETFQEILNHYADPGESYTYEYSFETTKVNSKKVSGDIKFGLGIGDNDKDKVEFGMGVEHTNSTTTKELNKIIVNRTNKDDELGTEKIYFYDPIVEEKAASKYIIKEYNTGIVSFGVTAF